MKKTQYIRQSSFGSGEFSPRTQGRTDIPQYGTGLKTLSNWIVNPQGSVTRRSGFKYVKTTKKLSITSWSERANPKNFTLRSIVWADGLSLFVAVGHADGVDAYIITSPDAVTWTERTNPKNFNLLEVVWTGSLLVAVGDPDGTDAYMVTSPDGITWTERANPKNFALEEIVWTGSLLVAVGDPDGTDAYLASSPDGITWTEQANPRNLGLEGIVWTGSLLVTVGNTDGTDAYIITSPDGITWTEQTNPKAVALTGIIWTGSLLIAVGLPDGTDAYIITSPDGITWTEQTNPKNFRLWNITWTDSLAIAVGVTDGTDAYIITSPDGITWTEQTNPKDFDLYAVGWDNFNSLLVAVGEQDGTDSYLITSPSDSSLRRLEPFVGSTGDPYVMEFGQLYLSFIRNEEYLESSPGATYEVVTPWDAADIAELQFAQAHDVMYICHPDYAPRKLTRDSETTFSLVNLMDESTMAVNPNDSTFKLIDGPYLDENSTVTTITISSAGTGSKTATASSALFTSTDVGRTVRIFGALLWGWGVITAFTSTTVVTIFIVADPNISTAVIRWALGAWSGTTGFPMAVGFFQQRLIFGGTKQEPMRKWATVIGSFEAFGPTQLDDTLVPDNAVFFTIASRRMLPIQWSEGGQDLFIGTKGGVFKIDAGEGQNEISPGSVRIRLGSSFGASVAAPALIGDMLVYVQQGGRKVRALAPQDGFNLLAQPDLTLLSEHLGESGIEQMEFSSVPSSILWSRRKDGLLIGLTLNPLTQILAWHTHQLPGSLTGADFPLVMSLAVLPFDGHDQLWIAVRRTVDSAEIETVEAMELVFDSTVVDQKTTSFFDSAIFYDGVATTSITGLDHLEGESVHALADGIMQGSFTVSSGAITLTTAASKVWVGLDYSAISDLETLPVKPIPSVAGSVDSHIIRIVSTMVEVLDTNGLKIGIDPATLIDLNPSLLPTGYVTGTQKPLVTGDREHILPGNTNTRTTVLLRPDLGLPATITGLIHKIEYDHF